LGPIFLSAHSGIWIHELKDILRDRLFL
jgi:hypothetical protein